MPNSASSPLESLNPNLKDDERIQAANEEWNRLYAHFSSKAAKGKKSFYLYKYASIVLAALTTVVSSLQGIYTENFPLWLLPVLSAMATVAVAFLGASSAQRIWVHSKTTGQQLQTERFLFNQQAGRYHGLAEEERIRAFSEVMIRIWNEGHGKWEQTVGDD